MEVAAKGKAKRRHLNAEECVDLGQSAQGSNVLTQPHTSNQRRSNRDPNWGLYPRTPTKRGKWAPASGSPPPKQKAINDFFSVSGVISSSPHKSLCSSTFYPGETRLVEEEEDDDDISLLAVPLMPEHNVKNEDEIDDSLLAAVIITEPKAAKKDGENGMEEEDIDDYSLLAAAMVSEAKANEEREVDHLEGMTAEMFGDDDEFVHNDVEDEEEDVEPLPDAHFGLLGSSNNVLQQPQGCIDDLPEEVLRQILCLIPAQDLYRNVGLVCHRWRDIVQDNKFVPFKKQYYRYMMRETETVQNIISILRKRSIMASSQHSIQNLVALMAQHKPGERMPPQDVLECVKKHRLFPQAEASIRLRIPDIQQNFNLGTEGPNPYAAMAVILILSENVGDVQALVSLLSSCMSLTAIMEYLSHMAMMLLALKRNNIQISNRLHYNIYYVLYLLENGPFAVSFERSRSQIHLTREQQQILSHNIQKYHVVKIIAFAGTGKTTTLVKYAEQQPNLRFLYVAFNNSVAREARRRFPRNVDCKTVHSLAFTDVGRRYKDREKLTSNVKPFAINSVLPEGRGGFIKSKVVATTLQAFMASTDQTIDIRHVPESSTIREDLRVTINKDEKLFFVRDALAQIWNKMKDLNEKSKLAYYMTHDGYLKLWQLQNPKPCLSDRYDAIFIDEAQDCTPAIMDVLLPQHCGKILVGDPHQQIYTFKGAVNALNIANHTHIYYLTQSFRFGAEIAYVGASILKVCKRVEKILVGGKQKSVVCDENADKILEAVRTGVSQSRGKTAILSRCNLGVFSEAVRLVDANPNCSIHFIGDVENLGLDKIMDIYRLMHQKAEQEDGPNLKYIKDPIIRSFAKKQNKNGFWQLKKYATETEDRELEGKLAIVEKYNKRIPDLVRRLRSCSEGDFDSADFIVGTVHKAKGLEFDTVLVNDDFVKVPAARHNLSYHPAFAFGQVPDEEWNLLYVAATRARRSLIITTNIRRILTVAGEYYLKSEMPVSQATGGRPLPCSISNCPNCITPGSAFIMHKQPMRCTDGVCHGGPLCERCVWTRIGPTAFLMTDDVLSMAEIPQRFDVFMDDPEFMDDNIFMGLF